MTVDYVAVLPSIYPLWTERCLASCRFDPDSIEVVDNANGYNRGVAASWNVGVDRALAEGHEWLIVMSAALRFGEAGGLDFLEALASSPGAAVVEAAHGLGWHLIAFSRDTLERVGRFDENLYPAYYEDNDFGYRIVLAYAPERPHWPKISTDVAIAGFAHGLDLGGIKVDFRPLEKYYVAKWGAMPTGETYKRPFDMYPIDWWPEPQR